MIYPFWVYPDRVKKFDPHICGDIYDVFVDEFFPLPKDEEGCIKLPQDAEEKLQFLNVLVAADSKHIALYCKRNTTSAL